MEEAPTISVLMGVYNEEEYLSDAIESILNQTYEDFEFLIVDDNSSDTSTEIVRAYDDPRIVLLENETNKGLTVSLNRALEHATGKYIARQDADDRSATNRLERQFAFLDANEEVAVVGTGARLIDSTGGTIDTRVGYCNPNYEDFLDTNHLIHGSVLARRAVLEDFDGYDEFFEYSQDYELWLRLSKTHKIANIPEPLYNLRIHDESVYFSKKDKSALYAKFARDLANGKVSSDVDSDLRQHGILQYWEHLNQSEKAVVHQDLATRYLRYGHTKAALEECHNANVEAGWSLALLVLVALAYSGGRTVSMAIWLLRRYHNMKHRIHNRFFCPYIHTFG